MSEATNLPNGYHSVQPYLMFSDCSKAIAFLTDVFDATERMRMPDSTGRIQHAEIQIGDSVIMMADENAALEAYPPAHYGGCSVSLMIYVDDCDTRYRKALSAGAKSLREPTDQNYGDRMAGVLDPFGYKWWIAHPIPKQAEVTA